MKKMLNFIIIGAMLLFFKVNYINAELPQSIGAISQIGTTVKDTCGIESCYGLPLKVAMIDGKSVPVICTKYYGEIPVEQTCSKSNLQDNVRYGVAAIINEAKSSINSETLTTEYFAAEMAINKFLYDKTSGSSGADIKESGLSSTYSTLFSNYLTLANTAYDSYEKDSKLEISLSSTELNFSLTENGNGYVSNSITVSGSDYYTVTTNKGNVEKSGNSFKISIPSGTINEKTNITVKVSADKTIKLATNYNCGESFQTLTPILLDSKTINSNEIEVSGTFTPKAHLTINKVDSNNVPISGATIEVKGSKGYENTFKTNGTAISLVNLEYDTYTIKETEAPSGYLMAEEQTVTLSENNLSANITIINKSTKVTISKINGSNKKGLAGAYLEIQDADGGVVSYCKDEDGNASECKWISTERPYIIEGMPLGKYYLVETKAPDGYNLNSKKVEFSITNDDVTHQIEMANDIIKVEILKINGSNKKGLAGAYLEIQDADGSVVSYCKDEDGNASECKWISTERPYIIEGMPLGKYYLVETKAPEGFVLNEDKIEINVAGDGEIIKINIKNDLEVKVPDTLSSKSALMIAVAMFDMFLGIAIVCYVKENRLKDN